MKNPIQPLYTDDQGNVRFKKNAIVDYLLEKGGIDLNHLADVSNEAGFSTDDWEQFAQLIGYSLNGFGSLSYVTEQTYTAAQLLTEDNRISSDARRIEILENQLKNIKEGLQKPISELFEIHPDELKI